MKRRENGSTVSQTRWRFGADGQGGSEEGSFSVEGTVLHDGTPRAPQIGGIPVEAQLRAPFFICATGMNPALSGKSDRR